MDKKILLLILVINLITIASALMIGFMRGVEVVECSPHPTKVISPYVEGPTYGAPLQASWAGTASYYSWDGCVGCREDRLMANGELFDEDALTVAFNKMPLNSTITIKNPLSGLSVTVKVTDTGGFESLGRIIDLSLGTKEAIGCTDLCYVEIYK